MTTHAPYTDALERSLGRIVGDMQAKADLQIAKCEAVVAGFQARLAEIEMRASGIEAGVHRLVEDALSSVAKAASERVEEALKAIERPDPATVAKTVDGLIRAAVADAVASIPPVDLSAIERRLSDVEAREMPTVIHGKDAVLPDIEGMIRTAVAAIPAPRDGQDGKDADPEFVKTLVHEAVAAIPVPRDGRDADPAVIKSMVAEAFAAIPVPKDGRDGTDGRDADPEVIRAMVAEAIPPVESLRGPPGRLPVVKAWADCVHYDGDVVTHRGATYQALRDTGREPPHADWVCLAARGDDGLSIDVRGTYDEAAVYRRLDIVALNGGSFIALKDEPGPCPGDGWQLLAGRGKPGQAIKGDRGDRGEPGLQGPAGPAVVAGDIDHTGLLVLLNGDGTTVSVDLYPLLSSL